MNLLIIVAGLSAIAVAKQPAGKLSGDRGKSSGSYLPTPVANPGMEIPVAEAINTPPAPMPPSLANGTPQMQMQNGDRLQSPPPAANSGDSSSDYGACYRRNCLLKNPAKPCLLGSCRGCYGQYGETPFGALVHAHMKTQVCNGLLASMVLYQYDFCDVASCDAFKLNPHGEKRLLELSDRMLSCNLHPLVIERTLGNPRIDQSRRDYILKLLREAEIAIPDEWIVIGAPATRGMSGERALKVKERMNKELISPDNEQNAQEVNPFDSGSGANNGPGGGFGIPMIPMGMPAGQ